MSEKLKIIPLGGICEIGKNLTVYEFGGDIILVDCGLSFPDEDLLGVDLVIPDFSYLVKHRSRIRGLFVTHGHEDHIGAIPFMLREINCQIFCTKLTAGLINIKLEEAGLIHTTVMTTVDAGQTIKAGCFSVEFINVNHSIADSVSFAITTSLGTVIQTGDFKIDTTPVQGDVIDLARFGEYGKSGVLALLSDSTNVERAGYSMSERKVGETLDHIFRNSEQRILVTTFASNVHRVLQVIEIAVKNGRKIAITGRSMENVIRVASQLGYIVVPDGTIIDLPLTKTLPKSKVCIITTGSQGEPMSALYRMAFGAHKQVELGFGDQVIISASPIPGNEKTVSKLINELFRRGCEVIYEKLADIHVSGHACQEELKLMLALTKPKFFMPVHGEYRMLRAHIELAKQTGVPVNNTFMPELGKTLELSRSEKTGELVAKLGGMVSVGRTLVDSGGGNIGQVILRDRKHLSEDGLIVIVVTLDTGSKNVLAGPDVITRGVSSSKDDDASTVDNIRRISTNIMDNCTDNGIADWSTIKSIMRNQISDYMFKNYRSKPMILPIIMET